MSTKLIRPGITAAMTAGRALLAAGWRYDSTSPMADYTTIRTLLHPSGREIHARTVDGGEQTDLTLTGLTLDQVAGAITGAGLVEPVAPKAIDTQQQGREIKARYLTAGMTVIDGTDGPLVVTLVNRYAADTILVYFEGQPEPTQYGPEVGVTVVDAEATEPAAPDYWLTLAADLRQAADRLATLADTPKPTNGSRLGFYCGLLDRDHAAGRPVVDAIAAAFGATAKQKRRGSSWQYEADGKAGDLDVWAYCYVPAPEDSEKAALHAEVARLRAQLGEGGTR